jgi:hypothetical protein
MQNPAKIRRSRSSLVNSPGSAALVAKVASGAAAVKEGPREAATPSDAEGFR